MKTTLLKIGTRYIAELKLYKLENDLDDMWLNCDLHDYVERVNPDYETTAQNLVEAIAPHCSPNQLKAIKEYIEKRLDENNTSI